MWKRETWDFKQGWIENWRVNKFFLVFTKVTIAFAFFFSTFWLLLENECQNLFHPLFPPRFPSQSRERKMCLSRILWSCPHFVLKLYQTWHTCTVFWLTYVFLSRLCICLCVCSISVTHREELERKRGYKIIRGWERGERKRGVWRERG